MTQDCPAALVVAWQYVPPDVTRNMLATVGGAVGVVGRAVGDVVGLVGATVGAVVGLVGATVGAVVGLVGATVVGREVGGGGVGQHPTTRM